MSASPSVEHAGGALIEGGDRRWRMQREPRTPEALERMTVRERRRRYLDSHPEYFATPSHELADPLAYDRLVRRFQSAAERESDGRRKGYSGTLEADLLRAEAKAHAIATTTSASRNDVDETVDLFHLPNLNGRASSEKEHGLAQFKEIIQSRFLAGDDQDFDYGLVDQNPAYDDRDLEREQENRWFDDEEPTTHHNNHLLKGQTGIQDF